MFLSVIIPIYNTKIEYIQNIVENIQSQTFSDFEVILVDDGSEEEVARNIDQLISNLFDDRFSVIHRLNGGVSAARNAGMDVATGEYLVFIDADDLIVPNYFEAGYNYAQKYHADVIIGQMVYSDERDWIVAVGHEKLYEHFYHGDEIQDVKRIYLKSKGHKNDAQISGSACSALFRRECVGNVRFDIGVTHLEDQLFIRKCLQCAESVLVTDDYWYVYWMNNDSAMHNISERKFEEMILPYWDKLLEVNQVEDSSLEMEVLVAMMNEFTSAAGTALTSRRLSHHESIEILRQLLTHPLMKDTFIRLKIDVHKMERKEILKYSLIKLKMYSVLILLLRYTQSKLVK